MNHIEIHANYPFLSSKDIDIFYVISDLINLSEDNYTIATPHELERITGTTERTIRKNIHALIKAGLISTERQGHKRRISLLEKPP